MQFYWELELFDGSKIEVDPQYVKSIQSKMDKNQPIHTSRSGSIPAHQVKSFRPTDKVVGQTKMIGEATAEAFNEPILNEAGDSVMCKWVKKAVTHRNWENHYSKIGYTRLDDENGMAVIAIFKPIHQIDTNVTPYCSSEQVEMLEKRRTNLT